jgi:hypothetical protein
MKLKQLLMLTRHHFAVLLQPNDQHDCHLVMYMLASHVVLPDHAYISSKYNIDLFTGLLRHKPSEIGTYAIELHEVEPIKIVAPDLPKLLPNTVIDVPPARAHDPMATLVTLVQPNTDVMVGGPYDNIFIGALN